MQASDRLFSVIYVSSARLQRPDEIADILRASHRNNTAAGITGLLAHKDGNFIQILEGPEKKLQEAVNRIGKDTRHTGMIVLVKRPITERVFPNWSMAFRDVQDLSEEEAAMCSDLLEGASLEEKIESKPDICYKLLLSFKHTMRYE